MSEERRRHRRYEVQDLHGTLTGRERHGFEVLTLSRGGLLVTTAYEPPLGQTVDLELPLGPEVFRAPGRVVFIGEDNAAGRERRYRVGIGLDGDSAGDRTVLDRFIRDELEPQAASYFQRKRDTEDD
jgi:PilZ domain